MTGRTAPAVLGGSAVLDAVMWGLAECEVGMLVGTLAAVRRGHGLTQRVLAGRFGATAGQVAWWEVGRSRPSVPLLVGWAGALGLRLAVLDGNGRHVSPVLDRLDGESWESGEVRRLACGLRARREALGMSQSVLAVRMGVTDLTVRRWELAQFHPRPVGLLMWAKTLRCSVQPMPESNRRFHNRRSRPAN